MHLSVLRYHCRDTMSAYMSITFLRQTFIVGIVSIIALLATVSLPKDVLAVGSSADAVCTPFYPQCGCNQAPFGPHGTCVGGKNSNQCACVDTTNGFPTAGICVGPTRCLAKTTGGGPLGDISKLLEVVKGIKDLFSKGSGGGGSGSGGGGGIAPAAGTPGCTTFYQVTTPTADPCAIYTPSSSNGINTSSLPLNTSSDLLNALTGNTPSASVSSAIDTLGTPTTTPTPPVPVPTSGTAAVPAPIGLTSGVSGDIRTLDGGATVIINNQNTKANTEVAGFYGSDTAGTQQPQGLVAGMCQSRPWATNFLNYIIPPSFFDSICSLRGYQVGQPKTITVVKTVTSPRPTAPRPVATTTAATTTAPTGPVIPPEANIWAVPTSVPLGSRTTIFWNTKGVTSCQITSPDGSFTQTSLSGGGATVPLSGATTFTISCLTPSGSHITNYTTVNLSN